MIPGGGGVGSIDWRGMTHVFSSAPIREKSKITLRFALGNLVFFHLIAYLMVFCGRAVQYRYSIFLYIVLEILGRTLQIKRLKQNFAKIKEPVGGGSP